MDYPFNNVGMPNYAHAPEIPPHNEDVPLGEGIDEFEDAMEDAIHVELDRILLRMAEEDENAPEIPPHNEDIPLLEELFNFAEFIDFPVLLEVDEEDIRNMDPDQILPEGEIDDNLLAYPPELFFQEPEELDFEDLRQEAAIVEAVNVFAVAMVQNEPQVYQAEDALQHELPAARQQEIEERVVEPVPEERVTRNNRKRNAEDSMNAEDNNKRRNITAGDE